MQSVVNPQAARLKKRTPIRTIPPTSKLTPVSRAHQPIIAGLPPNQRWDTSARVGRRKEATGLILNPRWRKQPSAWATVAIVGPSTHWFVSTQPRRSAMDMEFVSVGDLDRGRAFATLVLAFSADPFVRWIYPEASEYPTHFPEALEAFGGNAFERKGVWRLGDFAAVSLWLPPGVEPGGEATVALFKATVDTGKFGDLLDVFGQMDEAHPSRPHWYLGPEAAGDFDVRIGGGPTVVRELPRRRPGIQLHVVQVPILLGRGVRLWDGVGSVEERYDIEAVSSPSGVTHLTFTLSITDPCEPPAR